MSEYNINKFLAEFTERTIKNLDVIGCLASNGENVFEVTQLINSLLGLVVLPKEMYQHIKDKDLRKASDNDYDEVKTIIKKCKDEKRWYSSYNEDLAANEVSFFIKHIRNAVSHSGDTGLRFYPINENGEINQVYFYDTYTHTEKAKNNIGKNTTYEFCVKLTIDEINAFVRAVSAMYASYEMSSSHSNKVRDYNKKVKKLDALLMQKDEM